MHERLKQVTQLARQTGRALIILLRALGHKLALLCKRYVLYAGMYCRISYNYVKAKWPYIRERLYQYYLLTRLNRPIGIFLLLWPTLWALWIAAKGKPDIDLLLLFISGVVIMRSAGCVINDLVDRNLDPQVARTINRPIATGKVTVKEALVVVLILILCAFLLVLQFNPLTIKLSFIAVILAIIYPFTKRFTFMPQFFLGMAFAWAIPMVFAAQTGSLPVVMWVLFMATILWAVVYDTMYAMVDREDDIKMGMKSTAILFDDADRLIIGIIQILVLSALILTGSRVELGRIYYAGIGCAALLFIYQQYLIKDRIPENCFAAFMNNNWFGATVFASIFFNYYFS
jgi:4-hydroxybenzoate polyprenyltransferase